MKLLSGFIVIPFLLLFIPFVAISQPYNEDSLHKLLKKEQEDTARVNTLNNLAATIGSRGDFAAADSVANIALNLSKKLNAQSYISSSARLLGKLNYQELNYSGAIQNYLISFGIDSGTGDKADLGMDYSYLGAAYMATDKLNEATKYFSMALFYQKAETSKNRIYVTYQFLGILYKKRGNFPEALNNYQLSIKYAEQAKDYRIMGNDYSNLGNLQLDMDDDTDALKNYGLALNAYEKSNFKSGMGTIYSNIGNLYYAKHKYDEALDYYNQSLKIAEETGDKMTITTVYGNIGNVYEDQGKHEMALQYQYKSLKLDQELQYNEGIIADYINIAGILGKEKKYQEAKNYCTQSLAISKSINNKIYLRESYNSLATIDSMLGDFKNAYYAFNNYISYRDSLNNEETAKKIVKEQMNFEFDKKQAIEKAEQDKKDGIAALEKRKQGIITIFIGAGLILVLFFSGLLFSRFRVTQKQKRIIEEQKILVEEKNREVFDSITYAKRLQDATLPSLTEIKRLLPDSFVLYTPKDIVAGDFYWLEKSNDNIFIAACDCTGHGVPGALVSMVCSNALNRAVKEFRITEPGKILDKVRELVIETFEKSESDVKDGMDISLAAISTQPSANGSVKLQWAGAYNPLWIIKNNSILEIAPDKQPIGKQEGERPFNTHTLELNKGDNIYLFTDGYADQFGGPGGKKFKYKQLEQKLLSLSAEPMEKQQKILDETIIQWKGNLEQLDDILIIGIRV